MRPEEPDEHQRDDTPQDGASSTTRPPLDNEHDHHAYDEDDQEV